VHGVSLRVVGTRTEVLPHKMPVFSGLTDGGSLPSIEQIVVTIMVITLMQYARNLRKI